MKEWIFRDKSNTTLLVDKLTLLKGTSDQWNEILILLNMTFNKNQYDLYQSNEKVNIRDFKLTILSFSNEYGSVDITNTEDELKRIFLSYLELSPIYNNLVGNWEDLQEEVDLLNEELGYKVEINLKSFSNDIVEKRLKWKTNESKGIKKILQQVTLIKGLNRSKQNVFLIVSPEEILSEIELEELNNFINTQRDAFIVISVYDFQGTKNIMYNNQIINQNTLSQYKYKIQDLIPFVFEEKSFYQSINWYIDVVDNYSEKAVTLSLRTVDNSKMFIYAFLLFHFTKLPYIVDLSGISTDLQSYIESLIQYEV